MGMGMNGATLRPRSSMGMGSGVGGPPGGAMGNNIGMNMGMGMNVDTPTRTLPTSGNMGGQTHTPIRQGSLPPQTPTNSQQQAIGMSNLGAHSMRQNPMSAGTPSAAGGTGTQQSRRQSLPPGMSVNMGMGGISTSATNPGPAPASPLPSSGTIAGAASIGTGIPGGAHPPQMPSQQTQGSFNPSNVTPSATSANLGSTSTGASGISNAASAASPATSSTIASASASASSSSVTPAPSSSISNLPHLAALNDSTTHITTVPLLTSERHIRALSPSEIDNIKKWMDVDRDYDRKLRAMRSRMGEEARELFKPALAGHPHPPGQPPEKWLSTASPNWWERGGWGSTGSNWSRFRRAREGFDVKYSSKRDAALRGAYRGGRRGLRREGLKLCVTFHQQALLDSK